MKSEKWIPTKERLPELKYKYTDHFEGVFELWESERVLVTYTGVDIKTHARKLCECVAYIQRTIYLKEDGSKEEPLDEWYADAFDYAEEGGWSDLSSTEAKTDIIAWMPLPEPYEEQEGTA